MVKTVRFNVFLILSALLLALTGCTTAPQLAQPEQLASPVPLPDNSGKYMNPYTEDGVLAAWVDKAVNAKMGAQAGSLIGIYAGQEALDQLPFIGGLLGETVGEKVGREVAISMAGGMEYIVNTSDSSFNEIDELALYLYVNHSSHKHFQDALQATQEIYPELKLRYSAALVEASKNVM